MHTCEKQFNSVCKVPNLHLADVERELVQIWYWEDPGPQYGGMLSC